MKKVVRSAALLVAMTLGTASLLSVTSNAQEKDKAPKKAAGVAKIGIKEGKDGKFRFSIYDADGKFLAMSGPQGLPTKEDAAKAVEKLKAALKDGKIEYLKKDEMEDDKDEPKTKGKGKEKDKN
jgi:uncharacterized protein YegP (UPF0339 family)